MFTDDQQLVLALRAGDARAFRQFMDLYVQRLAAFVARRANSVNASVDDIVQSALIRAVRSLHQYRGEASLYTWLCQIAFSEWLDECRRLKRRIPTVSLDAESVAGIVEALPDPADCPGGIPSVPVDASGESVLRTLARIPVRYARVLEWKYGDDASVDEIGRLLGVSVTAAQSLLARARSAFREAWLADGKWPDGQAPARARTSR